MIHAIRVQLISFISLITDRSFALAQILFVIVIIYTIILIILVLLDKKFFQKYLKLTKEVIAKYDEFFYLLAKKQYKEEIDKQSVGWNPCIAAILPVLQSKDKSYLKHRSLIKSNIQKVEILLQDQIISDNEREAIDDRYRSLNRNKLFHKTISIFLTVFTLGVYKLFIEDISKY